MGIKAVIKDRCDGQLIQTFEIGDPVGNFRRYKSERTQYCRVIKISQDDNTLKIVVEMGGSRNLQWQSLGKYITNEF